MKDFLGNELNVGDKVVCIELNYKNLVKGEIVKITPKAMKVLWRRGSREETTLRFSDQVIKI